MLKNMKAREMQVAESTIINRPAGVGGLSVASDGEAQQSPGHSLLLVPLGSFRLLMMEVEWKVVVRSNFDLVPFYFLFIFFISFSADRSKGTPLLVSGRHRWPFGASSDREKRGKKNSSQH